MKVHHIYLESNLRKEIKQLLPQMLGGGVVPQLNNPLMACVTIDLPLRKDENTPSCDLLEQGNCYQSLRECLMEMWH